MLWMSCLCVDCCRAWAGVFFVSFFFACLAGEEWSEELVVVLAARASFERKTFRKIETGYCSFGEDGRRILQAHKRWKNGVAS